MKKLTKKYKTKAKERTKQNRIEHIGQANLK
jgi:hypothetical protein